MKLQRIKIIPFLAFICLLPSLVSLGFWQLNRADEKRQIIKLQEQRQTQGEMQLTTDSPDVPDLMLYNKIQSTGVFDASHQILLDNQVSDGRAGYYVFTPFHLKNSAKAVLVNRGWLALGRDRTDFPDISLKSTELKLTGRANRFPSLGIKLSGAEIPGKSWPALVQVIDPQVLAKHLGYDLFSFQIELDKDAPDGFKRDWIHKGTMPPEKHLAYAGQWFLLALTLTVLFLKFGIKKTNE